MTNAGEEPPKNHTVLNWPTLILIILTGGGNFFATQKNSSERQYEQERAHKQIHELHAALDGFEARQKEELNRIAEVLRNQSTLIDNQTRHLEEIRKGNKPGP
jgi:hypothetical protein